MDVDGAGHDDFAGRIVGRIGTRAWRVDNAAIADPDVTLCVALIGGIDDAPTGDARQHEGAPRSGVAAEIRSMASVTEIVPLGRAASNAARVPVAAKY